MCIRDRYMVPSTSSGPMAEPVSSNPGTAGTQDGVVIMALRGVLAASCAKMCIRDRP